jgi:hypothetical protein
MVILPESSGTERTSREFLCPERNESCAARHHRDHRDRFPVGADVDHEPRWGSKHRRRGVDGRRDARTADLGESGTVTHPDVRRDIAIDFHPDRDRGFKSRRDDETAAAQG